MTAAAIATTAAVEAATITSVFYPGARPENLAAAGWGRRGSLRLSRSGTPDASRGRNRAGTSPR